MRKYFAAVTLGALVVALSAASCKCNKDDEIPAMPSAAPPASTPPPVVDLAIAEEAGADADDAEADAKKVVYTTPSGLMACCNAIAQNAKSAPPAQAPFMLQAAAACKAAAAGNNAAAVNAALRQAGLPGCK